MAQVSGNDNRPKELGTTGIIVLNKCDMGACDCVQVLKDSEARKNALKQKKSLQTKSNSPIRSSSSKVRPNIRNSLRGTLSIIMCITILIM